MFNVGDVIIMTDGANEKYELTREGSIGTILEYSNRDNVRVEFSYLSVGQRKVPETFDVSTKYMRLHESYTDGKTQLERKIAFLYNKQSFKFKEN